MPTNWKLAFARVRGALMRRGRTAHDADDLVQDRNWRGGVVAWWRGGVVAWWRDGALCVRRDTSSTVTVRSRSSRLLQMLKECQWSLLPYPPIGGRTAATA